MKNNYNFVKQYLELIQIDNIEPPSLEYLAKLQAHHLNALAWNTFDVYLGRKVVLNPQLILEKFIEEQRGGLCYELNGAFCHLLQQLGFDANLATCFALHYHADPFDFPSDTHAVIIVTLNNHQYLVEVGYGDLIKHPVKLEEKCRHQDASGEYQLSYQKEVGRFQLEKLCRNQWIAQYQFETAKRELSSFTPNLEVVYQHPTYQSINYIKPDKSGTQIIKNNFYIIHNAQHVEQYSIDALGGLSTILKTRLGVNAQFVNQYFSPR